MGCTGTPSPPPNSASLLESFLPEHRKPADCALSYNRSEQQRSAAVRKLPAPRALPAAAHASAPGGGARSSARGQDGTGRGEARAAPLPLWKRLTRAGHQPQPMSASRGGPWNQRLRLLRVVRGAEGNQNRVGTAQVEPAVLPAPTSRRTNTAPETAPHRSARDRAEPQPHASPRTRSPALPPPDYRRSTHGDQETLKEFGVSGAGKSRVRRGGFICLGNVFSSSDCWSLCPVGGWGSFS